MSRLFMGDSVTKSPKNIIVIAGPTASGKTRLAVALASALTSEIISADSRQVYRGMDIGTGKDLDEYVYEGKPCAYHCIDIVDPHEIYTLIEYQAHCFAAIRQVWGTGKIPVLVGGTGLYIEAVLLNYRIPNVPENPSLRAHLSRMPRNELLLLLENLDPALYKKTDLSSTKRIVRALEIAHFGTENPIQWGHQDAPLLNPLVFVVQCDRDVLRRRIDSRLEKRLAQGMVAEVAGLLRDGVSEERCELLGMEYRHIAAYLRGRCSYDTMVDCLRHDIYRLAKRQRTWFAGMPRRGIAIQQIDGEDHGAIARIVGEQRFFPGPGEPARGGFQAPLR